MAVRWYYWHANRVFGPVLGDELKRLAATGVILPDDLIWLEADDPRDAVEIRTALDFSKLPPRPTTPFWLTDVQTPLPSEASRSNLVPDWLSKIEPAAPARTASPAPAPPGAPGPVQQTLPVTVPAAARPQHLTLGGASSVGRVRERNEDRFLTQQWNWNDAAGTHEVALLLVADGMGGYQGGEDASSLTVRTIATHINAVLLAGMTGRGPDGPSLATAVDQALREANKVVHQQASTDERFKGMGATAALVVIWDGHAYLGHVGDCRVYLYRSGSLNQLTEDQTLVSRMVALGQLSAEEAAQHEKRNEVTQAIGKRPSIEPSRSEERLLSGDYVLVACDGLAAHVDHPMLLKALKEQSWESSKLAEHLINLADAGGGTDNCTVVVAHYSGSF